VNKLNPITTQYKSDIITEKSNNKNKLSESTGQLILQQNRDWTNLREMALGGVSNACGAIVWLCKDGMLGDYEYGTVEAGTADAGGVVGSMELQLGW